MNSLRVGILIITLMGSFSCSDSDLEPVTSLEESKERWESLSINNYEFELYRNCFCWTSPAKVIVRNGEVSEIINLSTNSVYLVNTEDGEKPIQEVYPTLYPSINDFYCIIKQAEKRTTEIGISFNSDYGFPEIVSIDESQMPVDGGIVYNIENFKVQRDAGVKLRVRF